jgi:hypothetical protein
VLGRHDDASGTHRRSRLADLEEVFLDIARGTSRGDALVGTP